MSTPAIETKIYDAVERTLFLPKHTSQIGCYLRGTEFAAIHAFAGEPLEYLSNRCVVNSPKNTGSSKEYFSVEFPRSAGAIPAHSNLLWVYEPYEWGESFEFAKIYVIANSYYLFRRYSNKLNQKRFFVKLGVDVLRKHLIQQFIDFSENLVFDAGGLADQFVVCSDAYSEGGRGYHRAEEDFSKASFLPVLKTNFCDYEMGISQAGFVFIDGVACMQPARVWNGQAEHRFGASCTFYDKRIGSYCDVEKISSLTRSVGETLNKLGYVGAFGCDYLYSPTTNKVYFSEANLRYTGDVSLFCTDSLDERATFKNVRHPHSLHMLSFLGTRLSEVMPPGELFLDFESQGGGKIRAFLEAGSPISPGLPDEGHHVKTTLMASPPSGYLDSDVWLERKA